jgi:hypothetical protein
MSWAQQLLLPTLVRNALSFLNSLPNFGYVLRAMQDTTDNDVAVAINTPLGIVENGYGIELLNESGDGTADKDNWTADNNGNLTNPSTNLLRIARDGTNDPRAAQTALTTGNRYQVTGEARSDGNATPAVRHGGVNYWAGTTSTSYQAVSVEFVAVNTSVALQSTTSTGTEYTEWRNISITRVIPQVGPQLLDTSGDGALDKDNWTAGNSATLTNPSTNLLRVARNGVNNPQAEQTVLTVGKRYRISGEARSDGNATPKLRYSGGELWGGTTSTDWQAFDVEHVETGNGKVILRSSTSTGTEYTEWRNVVVQEVLQGRDVVINGTFDADTDWTKGAGWTIAAGVATSDGLQAVTTQIEQAGLVAEAKTYDVTFTISNYSSAGGDEGFRVILGNGGLGTIRTANGTYNEEITTIDNNTRVRVQGRPNTGGNIDNVSIKQVNILASSAYPGSEELSEAGDGTADKDNWTAVASTLSNPSTDVLRITGDGSANSYAYQSANTVGKRYIIEGEVRGSFTGAAEGQFWHSNGVSFLALGQPATWTAFSGEYTVTSIGRVYLVIKNGAVGDYVEFRNLTNREANPLNGDHSNVTIAQPSGVSGLPYSALYVPGSSSYTDIYSAEQNSIFNPASGCAFALAQVSGAGVWTDGTARWLFNYRADSENLVDIRRTTTNNQMVCTLEANNVEKRVLFTDLNGTLDMFFITSNWDTTADQLIAYANGSAVGTQTGLGTWVGNLDSGATTIGASSTVPANIWDGPLLFIGIGSRPLTADENAQLAQILGVV